MQPSIETNSAEGNPISPQVPKGITNQSNNTSNQIGIKDQSIASCSNQSQTNLPTLSVLKSNKLTYADAAFWQQRYAQGGNFDWYAQLPQLQPLFGLLGMTPNTSVLMIGCGNSVLSEQMHKKGYQVTNIDISQQVIDQMSATYPYMQWKVMDATKLQYEDGQFDYVLDKGTMDALIGGSQLEQTQLMLREGIRVARRQLILVTYSDPAGRKKLFERALQFSDYQYKVGTAPLSDLNTMINLMRANREKMEKNESKVANSNGQGLPKGSLKDQTEQHKPIIGIHNSINQDSKPQYRLQNSLNQCCPPNQMQVNNSSQNKVINGSEQSPSPTYSKIVNQTQSKIVNQTQSKIVNQTQSKIVNQTQSKIVNQTQSKIVNQTQSKIVNPILVQSMIQFRLIKFLRSRHHPKIQTVDWDNVGTFHGTKKDNSSIHQKTIKQSYVYVYGIQRKTLKQSNSG